MARWAGAGCITYRILGARRTVTRSPMPRGPMRMHHVASTGQEAHDARAAILALTLQVARTACNEQSPAAGRRRQQALGRRNQQALGTCLPADSLPALATGRWGDCLNALPTIPIRLSADSLPALATSKHPLHRPISSHTRPHTRTRPGPDERAGPADPGRGMKPCPHSTLLGWTRAGPGCRASPVRVDKHPDPRRPDQAVEECSACEARAEYASRPDIPGQQGRLVVPDRLGDAGRGGPAG